MKVRAKVHWIFLLSFFLGLSVFSMGSNSQAKAGFAGTQTCIDCHHTYAWFDNDPTLFDAIESNLNVDYVPLNLWASHEKNKFYTIPEAYVGSIHNLTSFDINPDHVKCEGCHGSGLAHFGIGSVRTPIPDIKTCTKTCHNETHNFPSKTFMMSRHANSDKKPSKYFDQQKNGVKQAITSPLTQGQAAGLKLLKTGRVGWEPVTRNERIEECSVCHNYALNYPQFVKKIAQNRMPKYPAVSCGACHNAHIPSPDVERWPLIDGTGQVTALSGSTVTAVTPILETIGYLNFKPYKIAANGAQDPNRGVWTRGSAVARPGFSIVKGVGTLSVGSDGSNLLFFAEGGFEEKVKEFNTVFISGTTSATANLPADAVNAGAPVTVKATLDRAGFRVEQVSDNTLVFTPAPTVAATVTYKKASGTGTLSVPITFTGSINFDIRDMYTNTENVCGSCHGQGTYKFSSMGEKGDGTLVDVSKTHNNDVMGQYLVSGHAHRLALPFEEFSASVFATSHQAIYPFDQSITGSGGVGSLRNRGNRSFELTQTPNPQNAYLVASGNTTQPVATSTSLTCNQCHHGLGSIDFQKDQQGTWEASVLWGDATITCLTCHDPHKEGAGSNVRIPVKLSYNSRFVDEAKNERGGINKFMDGTDIPTGVGKGIICLFCHQARESGLTVYDRIKGNVDPYVSPDQVISPSGVSFTNPHYLDGGAILWSKNAWEFYFNGVPQTYTTGNTSHQQKNCTGCHMDEASPNGLEGGHTWRPKIETCQTCHGSSISSFLSVPASADYDGDGLVKTAFEEIGTISPDTGLFGQVKAAMNAKGIVFDPDSYPYFFTSTGAQYRTWTSNTLAAAFNLAYAYKAGNAVYVHNPKYIVQILQDSLRALGVTPTGARPSGNRNATDYRTIVVNP